MRKSTKNETPNEPVFIDTNAVARLNSICPRYVRELTAMGVFTPYRIGRRCVRYNRAEVIAAMQTFRRA